MTEADKIKKQVEFYFGDSNYPKDKFLREKASLDENGFIDISVLLTFNRLKAMTESVEAIAAAVENSAVIALNDDKTKIRRVQPVPDVDDSMKRSVFVGNLPKDMTLDNLEEFFGASAKAIRMIKEKKSQAFLGMCYVELETAEAAENLVKSGLRHKEEPLKVMMKEQQLAELKLEREQKKKEKKEEADKAKADRAAAKAEEFTKGLILSLKNVGEGCSREDISESVGKVAVVKYVDFARGKEDGYIRVATPEDAVKVVDSLKAEPFEIKGKVPEMAILDGDEEKDYWKGIYEATLEKRGRKGGKGFKGGHKGGKGRRDQKRGRDGDSSSTSKRQRKEE